MLHCNIGKTGSFKLLPKVKFTRCRITMKNGGRNDSFKKRRSQVQILHCRHCADNKYHSPSSTYNNPGKGRSFITDITGTNPPCRSQLRPAGILSEPYINKAKAVPLKISFGIINTARRIKTGFRNQVDSILNSTKRAKAVPKKTNFKFAKLLLARNLMKGVAQW